MTTQSAGAAVFGADSFFPPPASDGPTLDISPELSPAQQHILEQAHEAFQQSRFEDADQVIRGFLDDVPDDPGALYLHGLILANLEEYDAALESLAKASDGYDLNSGPLIIIGDLNLFLGRTEAAQEAFSEAAIRDPANVVAHESLAVLAEREGDLAAAMTHLQKALEVSNVTRIYPRLHLARIAVSVGDGARALSALEGLSTGDDAIDVTLLLKGQANVLVGDSEQAEQYLQQLVSRETNPEAFFSLAQVLLSELRVGEAEELLKVGNDLFPDNPRIDAELASVLGAQQKYAEALVAVDEGLAIVPDNRRLLRTARFAQYRLGEFDAALETGRKLADPENGPAGDIVWMGIIEEAAGQTDAAIRSYEAALALDTKNVIALNNLAMRLLEDDGDRALDLAERAAAQAPDDPNVLSTHGQALMATGQPAEAVKVYARLAAENPEDAKTSFRYGQALLAVGQDDAARAAFMEALSLDPEFDGADEARAVIAVE